MSKPHSWQVEDVDGGPVGFADVWHCAECGACGGHVDRSGDYPTHVFLAGPALPLSVSDCDEARRMVDEYKSTGLE